MSSALVELLEEAQHGTLRSSVLFSSFFGRALSSDARGTLAGPGAYFTLDGSEGAIDIPTLPLPSGGIYAPGRGWAVSLWVQLAPGGAAGSVSMSLVRFWSSSGSGCEMEISLTPTDSPQAYTLTARVIAAGGGAFGARSTRRAAMSCTVRLGALRWHHITFSQSAPILFKTPRGTLYVNGRSVSDEELPCPPLPFMRATVGSRFKGSIAHVALWGERLPPAHVAALYARGPNAPSLHHTLSVPSPSCAPPDIRRAGLLQNKASLDALHEGLPHAASAVLSAGAAAVAAQRARAALAGVLARVNPNTNNTLIAASTSSTAASPTSVTTISGSTAAAMAVTLAPLPPLLALLDAAGAVPVAAARREAAASAGVFMNAPAAAQGRILASGAGLVVSALDGLCITDIRLNSGGGGDEAGGRSSTTGAPGKALLQGAKFAVVEIPLWWARGNAIGEAAMNAKKSLAAIIPLEISAGLLASAPRGFNSTSSQQQQQIQQQQQPRAGSASAIAAAAAGAGASIAEEFSARLGAGTRVVSSIRAANAWAAVGGAMRVIDLIRAIPVGDGGGGDGEGGGGGEGVGGGGVNKMASTLGSHALTWLLMHPTACGASTLGIALAAESNEEAFTDPVASLISVIASLVRDDFASREELFQMRGAAALAAVLRARVIAVGLLLASGNATNEEEEFVKKETAVNDETKTKTIINNDDNAGDDDDASFSFTSSSNNNNNTIAYLWARKHPVTLSLWLSCADLLDSSRAWGNDWSPLYIRVLRYIICDWRLWTMPVERGGGGGGRGCEQQQC